MVMTDEIGQALANAHTYADREKYHALLSKIRHEDPLYWATPDGYRPFWAVTKHADISEIELHPELFPSGPRLELFSIDQEDKIRAATGGGAVSRTMLHMDGPEHRAYRGMSQGWFMAGNLREMEPKLQALAKEYVDKLARAGGEIDFVHEISELFPLRVILMILGLPAEDAPELLRLTRNFNNRTDVPVPKDGSQEDLLVNAAQEIFDYFGAIYDERKKNPRADVASVIAQAQIDGKPINRLEALSYYLLLGLAGHDTTNGTISGAMLALIQNPGELARLKQNPDLIPSAVDEMLRWVSPVNNFMRTASQDCTLRGKTIKKGDGLLLLFASANRDEEVFESPFTFKIDRKPNPHIAFGYGAHVCLGQALAKMELRTFFTELVSRIGTAEVTGTPKMLASVTANQLVSLPIRYSMGAKERIAEAV
jgi:cytochrome P450